VGTVADGIVPVVLGIVVLGVAGVSVLVPTGPVASSLPPAQLAIGSRRARRA
jgi:hypothetical protein